MNRIELFTFVSWLNINGNGYLILYWHARSHCNSVKMKSKNGSQITTNRFLFANFGLFNSHWDFFYLFGEWWASVINCKTIFLRRERKKIVNSNYFHTDSFYYGITLNSLSIDFYLVLLVEKPTTSNNIAIGSLEHQYWQYCAAFRYFVIDIRQTFKVHKFPDQKIIFNFFVRLVRMQSVSNNWKMRYKFLHK